MTKALAAVDGLLSAYAREHGGRFIRFGSTATGAMRPSSDVDLVADFSDDRASIAACLVAETACFDHALTPDVRPACWTSDRVLARARSEGILLP